jgi:hypothetical protein
MEPGKDDSPSDLSCQWCGTAAPAGSTTCSGCGAALGQREDLGGLVIPGVTSVDPALQAYDAQPLRIPRSSPTQGLAGGTIAAAALGGPVGLAALGGLAAVAAVEFLGGKPGGDPATIGAPSEAALQMVERLNAAAAEDTGSEPEGGPRS